MRRLVPLLSPVGLASQALLVVVALQALGACGHVRAAAPQRRPRPAPQPPSPTYQTLDGRVHHYAVTRVEDFEDHYIATFLHHEGTYCVLSASAAQGVRNRGCGFPASLMKEDRVPRDKEALLPALRAAVLEEEPDATALRVRHEGAYRIVLLEEEVPCQGKHGNGYNIIELRYDAQLTRVLEKRHIQGSLCGAATFYWASPAPRWLAFTSPRTLLGPETSSAPLPPELAAALAAELASPPSEVFAKDR